jgi:hypothetical protein
MFLMYTVNMPGVFKMYTRGVKWGLGWKYLSATALLPIGYVAFSGWRRRASRRIVEMENSRGFRSLSLNISSGVYGELSELATERRGSLTDLVRFALGLARIAIRETSVGNKLIVTTADGKPLKEITVPDRF